MEKIKLFCFPYAGGSATVYREWKKYLHPLIELEAVELAGRGSRIMEDPYQSVGGAVADVLSIIKPHIAHKQYAIFGHSMGSLIGYELAQHINSNTLRPPLHLFFSGRGAPHIQRPDKKKYHLMEEDEFKREVLKLGGTPPEFFHHPDLMNIFIPILKNDFRIVETYPYRSNIHALPFDFTVFLGRQDDLTEQQCSEWSQHTTRVCNTHYFEGGHFFLHQQVNGIVKLINQTLVGGVSPAIKNQPYTL